jgi:hypothetical protein
MKKTTITHLRNLALVVLAASLMATPSRPTNGALASGKLVHADDADDPLLINLWPDGIVPYRFDDGTLGPVAVHPDDVAKIETQMARWEKAFTLTDPLTGEARQYLDFRRCDDQCSGSYLVIRYNKLFGDPDYPASQENPVGTEAQCNNMSVPVGLELTPEAACGNILDKDELARCRARYDGITELHLRRGTCPSEARERGEKVLKVADSARTNQDCSTILHELGHALGLWHEFNRVDADAYLNEQPADLDGAAFSAAFNTRSVQLMPLLGNYDYDSIMAYGGHKDLHDYPFSRKCAEKKCNDTNPAGVCGDDFKWCCEVYPTEYAISPGVKSRLLQYYAHQHRENWGFFRSLSFTYPAPAGGRDNTDVTQRRNPYLPGGVTSVGTPAIAFQSEGNYDVFARGSDNRLHWRGVRNNLTPVPWQSLGCCFGSDPAAISTADGEIDLFAVGATSGKLIHKRYQNGEWQAPVYVQGGYPAGGIKQTADGGYLGPAVASRGPGSLDVFVVRSDGRLSIVTLSNGQWTGWTSLGLGYNVTARPAAVALSATRVQLAINRDEVNLYEPVLIFPPEIPSFRLGSRRGTIASLSAPALTKRNDPDNPYRVLIVNADGRISHKFANGSWRDIGGMPKPGTGPSAVATGPSGAYILMNGADLIGCDASCGDWGDQQNQCALNANGNQILPGRLIEPGGLWLRHFR